MTVLGANIFYSLVNSHFPFFSADITFDSICIVSNQSGRLNYDCSKASGMLVSVYISSQKLFLCIPFQFRVQWHHITSFDTCQHGSTYATEISKCYKLGLLLSLASSQLLTIYQHFKFIMEIIFTVASDWSRRR